VINANPLARREFLRSLAMTGATYFAAGACAAEPNTTEGLKEPIHRVAKAAKSETAPVNAAANATGHPLETALEMAKKHLAQFASIKDYTCRITKQERIKNVLGPTEQMEAKIRNRKTENGKIVTPLSVYLNFISPDTIKGREVIWVEGQNENKLRAHEGGFKGKLLPSVWLHPEGMLAMNGQLHPIYDIGIENLILKLIERGQRELKYPDCEVKFIEGAKINGRGCTVLEVMHPVQKPHFEFYKAQIFIDDEMQVPIRYAAYHWPEKPTDKEGPVIEAYTYTNVKLNVGLTDADFDSNNPNYRY
jgi:hypothetical protein